MMKRPTERNTRGVRPSVATIPQLLSVIGSAVFLMGSLDPPKEKSDSFAAPFGFRATRRQALADSSCLRGSTPHSKW